MKKVCPKCKKEYPLTAEYFTRNKGRASGYNPWCKRCHKEYSREHNQRPNVKKRKREWRKLHRAELIERDRVGTLRRRYGLSPDQHQQMYVSQDVCTDHDHNTNKVRQLLCYRCNIGVGYVENGEFLRSAIEYLKRHG